MGEAGVDAGLRPVLRLPEQVLGSRQACITGSAARGKSLLGGEGPGEGQLRGGIRDLDVTDFLISGPGICVFGGMFALVGGVCVRV